MKYLRRSIALLLAATTLWTLLVTVQSHSLSSAIEAMSRSFSLSQALLQWELPGRQSDGLSLSTLLVLHQSPLLLAARSALADSDAQTPAAPSEDTSQQTPEEGNAQQPAEEPAPQQTNDLAQGLQFLDNGIPSETIAPTSEKGYTVANGVYIKNSSRQTVDTAIFSDGTFAATLGQEGPQVLIVHTHGSEAYTMPAGEEYVSAGNFRTSDTLKSVVRVGDEIASVLSTYGISVLHDRTLHDSPEYNGAYSRSLASIEDYLAKYPTISFILDVHRDAIQDADGNQYKVISREEPRAAQMSLVMGSDYDHWQDNLRLAVAVQKNLSAQYPTLMRPITLRNTGYNQEASAGSLLLEVGAAGNSLDEAIYAARLFAQGFAQTIGAKIS